MSNTTQPMLTVNHRLIQPCGCINHAGGELHWSGADIERALGRPMVEADLIAITYPAK